ncbi:MAG TPA: histidinol-phosphatase HisJ family protein, partial [Candidatus Bathyarchaeia archaeon]|nr:histidinol-phosphatase HisJ family protein [Candidatus Bathyarchaeia archaeon]
MIPVADYHMHTPLCGHAVDEPEQYARHAIEVGLKEIGFSDHAPFLKYPLPGITMNIAQLPQYHRMIESVARRFSGRLSVKVGIEADYLPGYEEQTRVLLAGYPYDYVYGSVHFIDEWAFDNPEERARWNEEDVNQVYDRYYDLLAKAAESRLFDIMAHVDLVKKFGNRPDKDMTARVRQTACIFKSAGVAIE